MVDTYTQVQSDNLTSAIRDNCRKAIEDAVSDPSHAEKRHWIYDREPHTAGTDFDGYPVIYITEYTAESAAETMNDYNVTYEGDFNAVVEVTEDNPQYMDAISDDFYAAFQGSGSPRVDVGQNGLFKLSIDGASRSTGVFVKDKPLIRREFNIGFEMYVDMG